MKTTYFVLLIVGLAFLCPGLVSASTISISPASIPGVGMSGSALISLDTADQGLSGYIFSIYPENPQVAKITGVTFPEWASLSEATPGDGAAYTIRALDLNDAIGYRAQSVPRSEE
ncbi:MAG: hypothetical protein LUQ50_15455, partial [Methanospirillum sp.]|uniref:hypothetical protein n=1 Tax=Methanospirillum sp. TaxID=45200 RepID=UPI00236DC4B9